MGSSSIRFLRRTLFFAVVGIGIGERIGNDCVIVEGVLDVSEADYQKAVAS